MVVGNVIRLGEEINALLVGGGFHISSVGLRWYKAFVTTLDNQGRRTYHQASYHRTYLILYTRNTLVVSYSNTRPPMV